MNLHKSLSDIFHQLQELRQIGDAPAKEVISKAGLKSLFHLLSDNKLFYSQVGPIAPLYFIVNDIKGKLQKFDQSKIKKGQIFFERYAPEVMSILGLYSLPYCYAAEEGAKILVQSKYLVDNPDKRLQETGEFLIAVCQANAFDQDGAGLGWILKTRLMHEVIRQKVEMTGDIEEMPINQEDLIGTNLSFSLIVLRGLKKMGIIPSEEEVVAYLYLWKCIGEMLGIALDTLPESIKEASILERAIRTRQFRDNEAGRILMRSLVDYYRKNDFFAKVEPDHLIAAFMGQKVASMLGLPTSLNKETLGLESLKLKNYFTNFYHRNFDTEMKRLETQVSL